MTPGEVAAAFNVNPKTVTRWADLGRIPSIRTLGGHRRFRRADVQAALRWNGQAPNPLRHELTKPWWEDEEPEE